MARYVRIDLGHRRVSLRVVGMAHSRARSARLATRAVLSPAPPGDRAVAATRATARWLTSRWLCSESASVGVAGQLDIALAGFRPADGHGSFPVRWHAGARLPRLGEVQLLVLQLRLELECLARREH